MGDHVYKHSLQGTGNYKAYFQSDKQIHANTNVLKTYFISLDSWLFHDFFQLLTTTSYQKSVSAAKKNALRCQVWTWFVEN